MVLTEKKLRSIILQVIKESEDDLLNDDELSSLESQRDSLQAQLQTVEDQIANMHGDSGFHRLSPNLPSINSSGLSHMAGIQNRPSGDYHDLDYNPTYDSRFRTPKSSLRRGR